MLLDAYSYAFGHGKVCFRKRKTMLLTSKSNALEVTEQCSSGYGAMF